MKSNSAHRQQLSTLTVVSWETAHFASRDIRSVGAGPANLRESPDAAHQPSPACDAIFDARRDQQDR
jgi:hypothetical protein